MLPRTLEPEVMDSFDDAWSYDAMDHSLVNRVFADDFLALAPNADEVLDVGTGTAQIPIQLAQLHPTIKILAIDLSENMLALGRRNVERVGVADRVKLQLVDAKGLPFADGRFSAVVSNSIVHHIPEPAGVLAEMVRVLQTGGRIFVRDLLRPADSAEVERLVELHAGDADAYQKELFSDSFHAALTLEEIRDMVAALGFPRESVQRTTDRHWTWSASRSRKR